jgi:hypothetical protein
MLDSQHYWRQFEGRYLPSTVLAATASADAVPAGEVSTAPADETARLPHFQITSRFGDLSG